MLLHSNMGTHIHVYESINEPIHTVTSGADPGKNKGELYHPATGEGIQCSGEQRREVLIQSARSVENFFHCHFPVV